MKLIVFQMLYRLQMLLLYRFTHLPNRRVWPIYCWYSGPDPVVVEAEPEEAVGELHRVIEWQPDDVM